MSTRHHPRRNPDALRRRRALLADRPFLRYFVPLVTLTTAIIVAGATLLAAGRIEDALSLAEESERTHIAGVGPGFAAPIVSAAGDLAILSRQSVFTGLETDPTPDDLDEMASVFAGIVEIRRAYDQARFIDNDGIERARVDMRSGAIVRIRSLQDKSDRYYFTEAIDLPPGALFVSRLDLNVEQGRVEYPFRPTMRMATPVFRADGSRLGIIVLNLAGSVAIDALTTETASFAESFHLVDEDGYWLAAPDAALEWGFMLDRPDQRLPITDEVAWARMRSEGTGQFRSELGLYTFRRISPLPAIRETIPGATAGPGTTLDWYVYSFVPSADLASIADGAAAAIRASATTMVFLSWLFSATTAWALGRQWSDRFARRQANLIFATSSEGLVVLDADRTIVAANPAFSAVTGFDEVEAIGHPFEPLTASDETSDRLLDAWETLERKGRWQGIVSTNRPDGSPLDLEVSMTAVFDEAGVPVSFVATLTDDSDRVAKEREHEWRATHDPLTTLPNRVLVDTLLERALAERTRYGGNVAVLFIDLDGFKEVNDTLGHDAGDEVLREAARRIQGALRDADAVGRLGGDEFLVVLSRIQARADVEGAADRIISAIAPPIDTTFGTATVRASIGLATTGEESTNAEDLVSAADAAMYAAKAAGGARWQWAVHP